MDNKARTEAIIERLAAGEHAEDIAFDIADRSGERYPDVEAQVLHVRSQHENRIMRKQSPLLTLLALMIFLGGLGLTGAGLYIVVATFVNQRPAGDDPLQLIGFLFLLIQNAPQGLYVAVAGLAAVLGSLRGMQKVWEALLDKAGAAERK
jgi:hypothetical protein